MADKLLIDKLFLLETQLRKFHEYKILEPFVFNPKDAHEVQSAAKKIASWIWRFLYWKNNKQKMLNQ